ncbi:transmembrane protein 198-like [Engraulis encrasicolus]|uniref:transmembrane protein 198-like n=1 Tax=Engraulis encrasicolus TaxID=184585 RepID=UPI002FD248B4
MACDIITGGGASVGGCEPISTRHLCSPHLPTHTDTPTLITIATCTLLGTLYCFWGYRCLRLISCLSGLLLSVCVCYCVCGLLFPSAPPAAAWGVCVAVSVLVSVVTAWVRSVSVFLSGLQLGLLLSGATLVATAQYCSLTPLWLPLVSTLGTAALLATLALHWPKALVITSSSCLGSALLTLSLAATLGVEPGLLLIPTLQRLRLVEPGEGGVKYDNEGAVEDYGNEGAGLGMCWYGWVVLGAWPLLTLLGIIVQWRLTAYHLTHTPVFLGHRQQYPLMMVSQRDGAAVRKLSSQRRHTHTRRTPSTHSHRKRPTPLKRYAGDVLAPSYLRHLQECQSGTGSSASSLATLHTLYPSHTHTLTHTHPPHTHTLTHTRTQHTIIDFDFETGSMVPLTSPSSSTSTLQF